MKNDFGSWFLHQLSDRQSPAMNALGAQFNIGLQNTIPARMSPCAKVLPMDEHVPAFQFSGVPHFDPGQQMNEPHGWFYCYPRFRQAFTPSPSSVFTEKLPCHNPALGSAQKRFLVFDQSGDQTTLVFNRVVGSSAVQCPTPFAPKHDSAYDLNNIGLGTEGESILHREPAVTYEHNENKKDEMGSEMYHEDTEEINALLYSDDDEYGDDDGVYSDDDEVASTGHSPSGMTDYVKQELLEESEEIASSNGPIKRRKVFEEDYEVPSLMDTATSFKPKGCFDCDDTAESSYADGKSHGLGGFGYLSGNKGLRKDKIRETVGVLQSIIPGGEGKDAIGILDEAIDYLRSLKRKAKALGVDTL